MRLPLSTRLLPLLIVQSMAVVGFGQQPAAHVATAPPCQAAACDLLGTSGCQVGGCDSCGQCASDCCCGGFFGGGEYLYIRTHFSEAVAFATISDSLTPGGLVRTVRASELDFDYESSFRAFLGYDFGCGSEVQVTYWYLDTDTAVSGVPLPGQIVVDPFGNMAIPGTRIDTSASVVMNVFDVDYLKHIRFCHDRFGIGLVTGLRVADVDQFYDSQITAGGGLLSSGVFNVQYNGIGPHFAFQGSTSFGACNQFSLFGSIGTAILVGDYEVSSEVLVPGFVLGGQFADRTRAVPVLESRLGGSWQIGNSITLSAGWMFQAWFNIGTSGGTFDGERLPFAPVDTAFGGADDSDIMSFDGLFVRAEARF